MVEDGILKTIHETAAEKDEQDRIRREYTEKVRLRVRNMMSELCNALLKEDEDEIMRLRQEYKSLRVYL